MISKSVLKTVVLTLIVLLNFGGIFTVGKTLAYFLDKENSTGNIYKAGVLDFSLVYGDDFPQEQITPCFTIERSVSLENHGNPIQYEASADNFSGSLCQNLNLTAFLNGNLEYSGPLQDFKEGAYSYSDPQDWSFQISLADGNVSWQNKSCQFEFAFEGWQENLASPVGFYDTERVFSTVTTGDWVPEVEVLYPNGGETWYLVPPGWESDGMGRYDILWEADSPIYDREDLEIDIWFCKDHGNDCFFQIADGTENDGSHTWTVPYEEDFITDEARVKVIATDPCGSSNQDMSDSDFCPPMLTVDDILGADAMFQFTSFGAQEAYPQEDPTAGQECSENGINRPCGIDKGACQIGVQVCEQGVWSDCMGSVFPTAEICDEVDNDCDGQVDEGSVCSLQTPENRNSTATDPVVSEEPPGQNSTGTDILEDQLTENSSTTRENSTGTEGMVQGTASSSEIFLQEIPQENSTSTDSGSTRQEPAGEAEPQEPTLIPEEESKNENSNENEE